MAKPPPNDLNYGHLGKGSYSVDSKSWIFGRAPGQGRALRQLGPWKTTFAPIKQLHTSTSTEHTHEEIQQAARSLSRTDPDVSPSLEFIPRLAAVSTAIVNSLNTYDPAVGDLLSYGSVTTTGAKGFNRKRERDIVAIPSGQSGNILRLVAPEKERQGWLGDSTIWLEGRALGEGESGYWVGDGAPIQQLCFDQSGELSQFLAARFSDKTVFFHPTRNKHRQPATPSRLYKLPSSHIDPKPILSLLVKETGGTPHADVAFNPKCQRQFGLIDQKGNWTIWDIESSWKKQEGTTERIIVYSVSCTTCGHISLLEAEEEHGARQDGWGRILWIGDVTTILVCDRRRLEVFDVGGSQSTLLESPSLVSDRSAEWILDVKRNPCNEHRFFVLTSTRLFLMAVTTSSNKHEEESTPGASILLSWTHFRELEDVSLQLYFPPMSDDVTYVFLYSRLNSLITVFQFSDDDQGLSQPISRADPMSLEVDDSIFELNDTSRHIAGFHFDRLAFAHDKRLQGSGPGHFYMANQVQFYRLTLILSDLSVYQAFLYSCGPDREGTMQLSHSIMELGWSKVIPIYGRRAKFGEWDGFIVPDGMEDTTEPTLISPSQPPRYLLSQRSNWTLDTISGEDFGRVNYGYLYQVLAQPDDAQKNSLATEDVTTVIERVHELLQLDPNEETLPPRTMLEMAEPNIQVADIDNASSKLQDAFSHGDQPVPLMLTHVASGRTLGLFDTSDNIFSVASLYDIILGSWIAPLSIIVPWRLRQTKERLARRIAAEAMLASSRIRQSELAGLAPASGKSQSGSTQDSAYSLSTLPPHTQNPLSSSATLPSSQWTAPSQVSESQSQLQTEPPLPLFPSHSNPLTRLSQHLHITKPSRTIPQNIFQVLMHWQTGADPSIYDWAGTTHAVNEELGIDELSLRQKEKRKRKAERLLKRKRRELEIDKKNKAESQPIFGRPVGGLRSSPVRAVGLGSSSQVLPQQSQAQSQGLTQSSIVVPVMQSQTEPGRHGGRPVFKKKKKGRVSGF